MAHTYLPVSGVCSRLAITVAQNSVNGTRNRELSISVLTRIFLSSLFTFSSEVGTPCKAACLIRLLDLRLPKNMTGMKVMAMRPAVLVISSAVDA